MQQLGFGRIFVGDRQLRKGWISLVSEFEILLWWGSHLSIWPAHSIPMTGSLNNGSSCKIRIRIKQG